MSHFEIIISTRLRLSEIVNLLFVGIGLCATQSSERKQARMYASAAGVCWILIVTVSRQLSTKMPTFMPWEVCTPCTRNS